MIPLALYIHLPWCVRKCPYCDFNSHLAPKSLPAIERQYVQALLVDLARDLALIKGDRIIDTIFIGGGTPSLFSAHSLAQLLAGIRAQIRVHPEAEITLEANPGTAEQQKFADFRALGINRLSIGVQSFNSEHLQRLGRIHDGHEAIAAVEMAHLAGFTNFNLDLMYGLPGQTVEQAVTDVLQAVELRPTHLSHYQLTLEPQTPFARFPPPLPDDDALWAMQNACQEALRRAHFPQYEVSAYALPEFRCRHNLNYWEFGDYLGIGAGAHSKLTTVDSSEFSLLRLAKWRFPTRYLQILQGASAIEEQREVETEAKAFEFLLNVLRLVEGVPETHFSERTGLSLERWSDKIDPLVAHQLLEVTPRIRATHQGFNFLNDLLTPFVPS